LESHPQHQLAKRQMSGFGGVVSFRVRGGKARAHALAKSTEIFNLATSLGGVESLICCPAIQTHGPMTPAQREEIGVTDDLLRLSVGVEESADLIDDLTQALERTRESALVS
jgi:cystathionine gamma-lyase